MHHAARGGSRPAMKLGRDLMPAARDATLRAVSSKRIRLFVKPYCPWCERAEKWLAGKGIKYETVDVIADATAFDEMIDLSGQTLAPVIDVGGKVLADFGPEQLARFWTQLEQAHARLESR